MKVAPFLRDAWLLGAMLHTIIDKAIVDHTFLAAHCTGFGDLLQGIA